MFRVMIPLLLTACSGGTQGAAAPAPDVPERCRNIHVDRLAGKWLALKGNAADPKTRMQIVTPSTVGGDYEAWFIGGFFTKVQLMGEKREKDVRFTEVPSDDRAARIAAGELHATRMYIKPRLEKCALEVFVGSVNEKNEESIPPRGSEFVVFPATQAAMMTFQPATKTLFLGEAARDRKAMVAQVAEGGARPEHEMGRVPVGLWSNAERDGDPGCTYTMDLYFDDQKEAGLSGLAVKEIEDGFRHWFHEWDASYSGNHHFEMYRYRTCDGGERILIDIAAIEAVLQ